MEESNIRWMGEPPRPTYMPYNYRMLYYSIMVDAVRSLFSQDISQRKRAQGDVIAWSRKEPDYDHPFSFEITCDVLGVDANIVRKVFMKITSGVPLSPEESVVIMNFLQPRLRSVRNSQKLGVHRYVRKRDIREAEMKHKRASAPLRGDALTVARVVLGHIALP